MRFSIKEAPEQRVRVLPVACKYMLIKSINRLNKEGRGNR